MQRYKCIISYDGTGFSGYQVQPNKRTVQSEIEAALAKMHKGKSCKSCCFWPNGCRCPCKRTVFILIHHLAIPE